MNFQLSEHFSAVELFSRQVLMTYGVNSTWFLDRRILNYLEFVRARFGKTYLNNWYWGGQFDSRGFRSMLDPQGASMSQHRFGRATDCTFASVTPEEVRRDIIDNWAVMYRPLGITCIEAGVNWVHADMRYIPTQTELLIVKP